MCLEILGYLLAQWVAATEITCACACCCWACKRCCFFGSAQSENWREATYEEFHPVPRYCRLILGVYEKDLAKPEYADHLKDEQVAKKAGYEDTEGCCPPYMIYVDHEHRDVAVGIRGLHLGNVADYRLLSNLPGRGIMKWDEGYVHTGMFRAAEYLLKKESALLAGLMERNKGYTLTFAGHSLGSGVAALATAIVFKNRHEIGLEASQIHGFAIAPARSMSLNLAIKFSPIITSVILQDDFLPRTSTPIEEILALALCCICCMLCRSCLRDSCVSNKKLLADEKRLYPPGQLVHIVDRDCCGPCTLHTPHVRTAAPVEGRFERMVMSCNMTEDHSLIVIEKEAERALLEGLVETQLHPPMRENMARGTGQSTGSIQFMEKS